MNLDIGKVQATLDECQAFMEKQQRIINGYEEIAKKILKIAKHDIENGDNYLADYVLSDFMKEIDKLYK